MGFWPVSLRQTEVGMSREILVELFEMPSCSDPRVETAHNPVLRQVNEMVQELEADGVKVLRHVLSDDMRPFLLNAKISTLMRHDRLKPLPITMINGDIIKVEAYPSIEEIRDAVAGIAGVHRAGDE